MGISCQDILIRPNKVLLAVAFGLVALASLIEACGDETALTACELLGALAGAGRGRPEADKEALWSASAVAIGCDLPDMSNGFNPQGTSQIPPILHDLEGNASFKIEHNVARFLRASSIAPSESMDGIWPSSSRKLYPIGIIRDQKTIETWVIEATEF